MCLYKSNRRRQKLSRGQVLPLIAIMSTVLLGMSALALDTGYATSDRRALQTAADAAALAGMHSLSSGTDAANYVALQYLAASLGSSVPAGCASNSCPSATYTIGSNHTITLNDTGSIIDLGIQDQVSNFIPIFGSTTNTTASARAQTISGASTYLCGICALAPSTVGSLDTNANDRINVTNANIYVNSNKATAAVIGSGVHITVSNPPSPMVGIVGGVLNQGTVTPSITTGITPIADPLASVPVPLVAGTSPYPTVNAPTGVTTTINPGIYYAINLAGSGTLVMNPGTYVITSQFATAGTSTVTGNGVTLYFACSNYPTSCGSGSTCSAGHSGATLAMAGNLTLTSPTSGTYKGLLIFADRFNTAPFTFGGGTSDSGAGTIYGKCAGITLAGYSTINSVIIMNNVTVAGNATINIDPAAASNMGGTASTVPGGLTR